ncbi:uncharacterized protein LOC141716635 [Apium graveolens]|uniref:uncharacterized protein LOC141716635 n=1 Tax=Apium graveolens TaxID=4045 RepID=UPI003D796E34
MTSVNEETLVTENDNTTNLAHTVEIITNFDSNFQSISLESHHPLYFHPSNNSGQVLVTTALNGENFNEWKRSMSFALSAKNKLGFFLGKFKVPGISSPYYDHYQRRNDMIITWLLNSISPEIHSNLVYITSATDMWSDLHIRFAQINGPRIFELKKVLSELSQENLSISVYYTKFKHLYDDLMNVSHAPKCVCICNCKAKAEMDQLDKMMKVTQILMGLNDNFTNIRCQLLMMHPMLKLTQALALLQQEERQINYTRNHSIVIESAVMLATNFIRSDARSSRFQSSFNKPSNFVSSDTKFQLRRNNLDCSYCHGTNHTKDRWKSGSTSAYF